MAELQDSSVGRAREEYTRLIEAYSLALKEKRASARDAFVDASEAWDRIVQADPSGNEAAAPYMHLVGAFGYAVEARDKDEAERIFNLMPEEWRSQVDALELRRPGEIKIWLRDAR